MPGDPNGQHEAWECDWSCGVHRGPCIVEGCEQLARHRTGPDGKACADHATNAEKAR